MNLRTIHLRIKVRSLVDEAVNIRREANKKSGMEKWDLNHHRTTVVRRHTRHNLLAYGILIGTPYELMEKKCAEAPDLKWVAKIAKSFDASEEDIAVWMADAESHLTGTKKEVKHRFDLTG